MNILLENEKDYFLSYKEAVKLKPGTILKCQNGDYFLVVRIYNDSDINRFNDKKVLLALFDSPVIVNSGKIYNRFKITDFNTLTLSILPKTMLP